MTAHTNNESAMIIRGNTYPEIRKNSLAMTRKLEAEGYRRYPLTVPRGKHSPDTVVIFARRYPTAAQVIDGLGVLYGYFGPDDRADIGEVLPMLAD